MRKDAEKTEGSDLLVRLNKNYKTLSKGQKQLAAYITENSLCLEEYLEQLKSYTLQQPLDYETGGKSYRIYYVPAAKSGSTDVSVPTDKEYSISGNNMDGFIVTVEMS